MKRFLTLFIILFVLTTFIVINIGKRKDNKDKKEIKYDTAKYRAVEISYECEGEIENYRVYEIFSPEKSFVKKILRYPGEEVKKGDTIVILSNNELEYRYRKINYELDELKTKLKEMSFPNLSESHYRKEIKDLENEIRKKEIEFEYIKREYDNLNIVAPFNCYVLKVNSKEGEIINGIFLKLSNLDTLSLRVKLLLEEISKLKTGQKLKIVFYSHSNYEVEGILYYLNYEGEKIKENYEYFAGIKFKRIGNILPGSKANVKIFYDVSDKLCIPNDAIIEKNGRYYVLLKNGEKREIKTGISGSQYTEIISGLNEGDTIISGPFDFLQKKLYER